MFVLVAVKRVKKDSPVGSLKGHVHSCPEITHLVSEYHWIKQHVIELERSSEILEKGKMILEQLKATSISPEAVEKLEAWIDLQKHEMFLVEKGCGFLNHAEFAKLDAAFVDEKKNVKNDDPVLRDFLVKLYIHLKARHPLPPNVRKKKGPIFGIMFRISRIHCIGGNRIKDVSQNDERGSYDERSEALDSTSIGTRLKDAPQLKGQQKKLIEEEARKGPCPFTSTTQDLRTLPWIKEQ